jgi:hypothetical protein
MLHPIPRHKVFVLEPLLLAKKGVGAACAPRIAFGDKILVLIKRLSPKCFLEPLLLAKKGVGAACAPRIAFGDKILVLIKRLSPKCFAPTRKKLSGGNHWGIAPTYRRYLPDTPMHPNNRGVLRVDNQADS